MNSPPVTPTSANAPPVPSAATTDAKIAAADDVAESVAKRLVPMNG